MNHQQQQFLIQLVERGDKVRANIIERKAELTQKLCELDGLEAELNQVISDGIKSIAANSNPPFVDLPVFP